ncbi:MAG: thioredoxin family protein [Nevskiales bacterium]|nr:thioredoxin family protein [Nevskiales bacterium]
MALTYSNMMALGTEAPDFALPDTVSGVTMTFADIAGRAGTVVMFVCNHCPYVKHVNPELVHIARDYAPRGIGFVAISSNDIEHYPEDAPEKMKAVALEVGYPFPYLYDESQGVARIYQAACTPDFYLFDAARRLVYRGRLDASTPGNGLPLNGQDLRAAIDAVISGSSVAARQDPSMGCNIKWRA